MAADGVKTKPSADILATNINKLMRKKKYSDASLAETLKVTRQTIWKWRTGRMEPKGLDRDWLASFLDVPVYRLFRE